MRKGVTVAKMEEEEQFWQQYLNLNWTSDRRAYLQVCEYPLESPIEEEEGGNVTVSPLAVAGILIGLILLLSCVTIIACRLRKKGCVERPHLRAEDSYAPDGFPFEELRSICLEEFTPFFGPYMETLSQVNVMYPDSPPCYDECVGPGTTHIVIPPDDPPPYSWVDPCLRRELCVSIGSQEEIFGTAGRALSCPVRLQEGRQPIPDVSLSSLTQEAPPTYQMTVCDQTRQFH